VLRRAMAADPRDARAPYYLGDLLYDGRPEEALALWERSTTLDSTFPLAHRNLALAYANRQSGKDLRRAIAELELAVAGPRKYAEHFTQLDELYEAQAVAPEKRLALLEQNQAVVSRRDDALSREIGLKVFAGKYDEAIQLMTGRKFAVWEGGSLAVADHWVDAHLMRGQQRLKARQTAQAVADFEAAKVTPRSIGGWAWATRRRAMPPKPKPVGSKPPKPALKCGARAVSPRTRRRCITRPWRSASWATSMPPKQR
jgi:tetratricopeptide (TPR) repeat protein